MDSRQYKKMMEHIDKLMGQVVNNLEINSSIKRSKHAAKYPSIGSVQQRAKGMNLGCKRTKGKFDCEMCDNKKRNDCWREMEKITHKNELIKAMPYDKKNLAGMKISSLWILASHLNLNFMKKAKGQIINDIYAKEKKMGLIKEPPLLNFKCTTCKYEDMPFSKWPINEATGKKTCPHCGVLLDEKSLPKKKVKKFKPKVEA